MLGEIQQLDFYWSHGLYDTGFIIIGEELEGLKFHNSLGLLRQFLPKLIAEDVVKVQPVDSTGQIFTLKANYKNAQN